LTDQKIQPELYELVVSHSARWVEIAKEVIKIESPISLFPSLFSYYNRWGILSSHITLETEEPREENIDIEIGLQLKKGVCALHAFIALTSGSVLATLVSRQIEFENPSMLKIKVNTELNAQDSTLKHELAKVLVSYG
jgi:hypothetical protein